MRIRRAASAVNVNLSKPAFNPSWVEILEAGPHRLLILEALLKANHRPERDFEQKSLFAEFMIGYSRNDPVRMQLLTDRWKGADPILIDTMEVRLLEKTERLTSQSPQFLLDRQSKLAKASCTSPLIKGEWHLSYANLFENLSEHWLAQKNHQLASQHFALGGARRKSLFVRFLALRAHAAAQPEARLFVEYKRIAREAESISDFTTAALALRSISSELQNSQALALATAYAEKSLRIIEKQAAGSKEHGLCLTHLSQLLLRRNQKVLAKRTFLVACSFKDPEVQAACQSLKTVL